VIPKIPGISGRATLLTGVLADLSTLLNPFSETGDKAFVVVDE
jgi:hypothetical protein